MDRDGSVGVATRCGLDGHGSCPGGGTGFFAPVHTGNGAHAASCAMGIWSVSPGLKRPGRGVDHTPCLLLRWKKD